MNISDNPDVSLEIIKNVIESEGEEGLNKLCQVNKNFLQLCKDNKKGLIIQLLIHDNSFTHIDVDEDLYLEKFKDTSFKELLKIYRSLKDLDNQLSKTTPHFHISVIADNFIKMALGDFEKSTKTMMTEFYIEYLGYDIFDNLLTELSDQELPSSDSKKIYDLWKFCLNFLELDDSKINSLLYKLHKFITDNNNELTLYSTKFNENDKYANQQISFFETNNILLNLLVSDLINKYNKQDKWNEIIKEYEQEQSENEQENESSESE